MIVEPAPDAHMFRAVMSRDAPSVVDKDYSVTSIAQDMIRSSRSGQVTLREQKPAAY